MLNARPEPKRQPEPGWPAEDNEDAWERVLDCGAPGPDHAEPALFYQPGRRPPANAGAREDEA